MSEEDAFGLKHDRVHKELGNGRPARTGKRAMSRPVAPDPLAQVYRQSPTAKAVVDMGVHARWSRNETLEQCVIALDRALRSAQNALEASIANTSAILVVSDSGEEVSDE